MSELPSYVGWWGRRHGGKWHRVESEVTDRLVMHCGRQMKMELHGAPMAFALYPTPPVEACEQCAGRIVAD